MYKVYLKPGKEESLKRFHPWIFSVLSPVLTENRKKVKLWKYTPLKKNL